MIETQGERYAAQISDAVARGDWDEMLLAAKRLHAYETGRVPVYDELPALNGNELPGEDWESRLLREAAEMQTLAAIAAQGVAHRER